MSDTSTGDVEKLIEELDNDLSEAMERLSVTTAENSGKSSPPKNLSDMTVNVDESIGERSFVDKQEPVCTNLKVSLNPNYIICNFDNHSVVYAENSESLLPENQFDTRILRDDYEKVALDDLASTLKNPELQLESFTFNSFEDSKKMQDVLKSINQQSISVKTFQIEMAPLSNLLSILPYFKPGVLKSIGIAFGETGEMKDEEDEMYDIMEEVSQLEQWEQAEELKLTNGLGNFPFDYAFDFKRLFISEKKIDEITVMRFKLCVSDYLEYCLIEAELPYDVEDLHSEEKEPAPPNERTQYVSHYSICSDSYLEFQFFEKSIEIKKMKRSDS